MSGFFVKLEEETLANTNFRKVLFTAPHSQLVLMSLKPSEDIGSEVHPDHDQFIRIDAGHGQAIIDSETFDLADGSAVVIPFTVQLIIQKELFTLLRLRRWLQKS